MKPDIQPVCMAPMGRGTFVSSGRPLGRYPCTVHTPSSLPSLAFLVSCIYDGQGWDYSLAATLSVNTLPFNLLVGKDGKMAVRHVRGDELEAKVAELLK